MAAAWIEKVTGSLEQKKQYRQYKARIHALPAPYRAAAEAVDRYVIYAGGISDGDTIVTMLEDLADLWDQSAADQVPIHDVVGEDPVAFVEEFLRNYTGGQWLKKERTRLTEAISRAEAGEE